MSLSWEEPPAPPCPDLTVQDQLRDRPGSWAKVLTSDKVAVSRLGGELHREGFDIRATEQPDEDGFHSLYARWNPDGPTQAVVRPGSGDAVARPEALRDEALGHVLTATVTAAQDGADVEELVAAARQQVKALFVSTDEARRYLQSAGDVNEVPRHL